MGKTVLIVDDDTALISLLKDYLEQNHLTVYFTARPEETARLIRLHQPQLLILDVMLPGKSGFDVCREVRAEFDTPILMLTARGDVTDRIIGLEIGADDYLGKPFEPRELLARMQSIFRRSDERPKRRHLAFAGLEIDPQSRTVRVDGESVELSTMEFEVLELFARNPGRVMSRDEVLGSLKGVDLETYERSVDVLLSRLRGKLGDDPKAPRFFRTVRGKGYLFIAVRGEAP